MFKVNVYGKGGVGKSSIIESILLPNDDCIFIEGVSPSSPVQATWGAVDSDTDLSKLPTKFNIFVGSSFEEIVKNLKFIEENPTFIVITFMDKISASEINEIKFRMNAYKIPNDFVIIGKSCQCKTSCTHPYSSESLKELSKIRFIF